MMNLSESHMSAQSGAMLESKGCLCQYIADVEATASARATTNNGNTLRCPACVQRFLKSHIERHEKALIHHAEARKVCAQSLRQDPKARLSELQCESQRLRDRLSLLRKGCADMAVRVASQAVENDERREALDPSSEIHRVHLSRLEDSLLDGAVTNAIFVGTSQVRALRYQWARKAMAMHRLDIDPADANDSKITPLQRRRQQQQQKQQNDKQSLLVHQRRARGIGKIGGLPLPNAGPELYGVLPPRELQSALRLVASVTSTVARCLGIILPHPILLTPDGISGDITDTVSDLALKSHEKVESNHEVQHEPNKDQHHHQHQTQTHQQTFGLSSTSSLMSLMDGSWKRSAKNALKQAMGQHVIATSANNTFIPPSMDAGLVSKRLNHATAAILAEDDGPMSSKFALSADLMHKEDFAVALQLLQNDVVVLCIRAGVPVAKLWPAEAMLLNIHALDAYCAKQTIPPF